MGEGTFALVVQRFRARYHGFYRGFLWMSFRPRDWASDSSIYRCVFRGKRSELKIIASAIFRITIKPRATMAATVVARRRMAFLSSDLWRRSLASCPSLSPYSLTNPGRTAGILVGRRRPCAEAGVATSYPGRRALSTYEWKNMSKEAQKANKDFAKLSAEEILKVGEAELDKVEKALKAMEPFNEVFTVRREGLEVFAELGPHVGTYWIKFDTSLNQICLMSPRSGPHRYIYDKDSGRWIGEADKHDFEGMLTRDIIQSACGIPDF